MSNPLQNIINSVVSIPTILDEAFGTPDAIRDSRVETRDTTEEQKGVEYQEIKTVFFNNQNIPVESIDSRTKIGGNYQPVKVSILTGLYQGLEFDMGSNADELDIKQTAEWSDLGEPGIREGGQFQKISVREISFSCDYYLPNQDVSPLIENWAHLQELNAPSSSGNTAVRQPPILILTIGMQRYSNSVLTEFSPKYDNPLPGRGGFRHCVISLSFKSYGGMGSIYEKAPPHAPTSLAQKVSTETEAERAKRGQASAILNVMSNCLPSREAEKLEKIIKEDKGNDPNAYLNLDPETFVQAAISGMMGNALKDNEGLKNKFKEHLATMIARKEPGLTPSEITQLAVALRSGAEGSPGGRLSEVLPGKGVTLYANIKDSFDKIYTSTTQDKLKNNLLLKPGEQDAQKRLSAVASCGLELLQTQVTKPDNVTEADQTTIKTMNNFIVKATDAEIIAAFGINNDDGGASSRVNRIRSGVPYTDKTQFLSHATDNRNGYDGSFAWNAFSGFESKTLGELNTFLETATLEDVKSKLGVNDTIGQTIINQKPYQSTTKFYGQNGGVDIAPNYIYNFYKNKEASAAP